MKSLKLRTLFCTLTIAIFFIGCSPSIDMAIDGSLIGGKTVEIDVLLPCDTETRALMDDAAVDAIWVVASKDGLVVGSSALNKGASNWHGSVNIGSATGLVLFSVQAIKDTATQQLYFGEIEQNIDDFTGPLTIGVTFNTSTPNLAFTPVSGSATCTVAKGTAVTTGAVVIPSYWKGLKVTAITDNAFNACTGMTGITIPAGVTTIGERALYRCTGMTGVTIPANVTSLGNYAFYQCSSLTGVTIPASVTSIGWSAFHLCAGLTNISVNPDNTVYSSLNGVLFNKLQTRLITYPCAKPGSYTIPAGVTAIDNYAFYRCTWLNGVTIPTGVTSIEIGTFDGCSNLETVSIPVGVTAIGERAFNACSKLLTMTIPSGVTTIGGFAFNGCTKLRSVVIPNTVKTMSSALFSECSELTMVTIPAGVTVIETSMFRSCTNLWKVTIPSGVTSIKGDAFSYCSNLKNLYIQGMTAPTVTTEAFYLVNGCTLHLPPGATGYNIIPWSSTTIFSSILYE